MSSLSAQRGHERRARSARPIHVRIGLLYRLPRQSCPHRTVDLLEKSFEVGQRFLTEPAQELLTAAKKCVGWAIMVEARHFNESGDLVHDLIVANEFDGSDA